LVTGHVAEPSDAQGIGPVKSVHSALLSQPLGLVQQSQHSWAQPTSLRCAQERQHKTSWQSISYLTLQLKLFLVIDQAGS
jgi:hypothetical protein